MKKNNEKGFALVLSLVLLLAMSLMGGALIVISAGDHTSNNVNDEYQQTFYVAETALLEGEKYLLNQYLGPYNTSTNERDTSKRKLPDDTITFTGDMNKINYRASQLSKDNWLDTDKLCFDSFSDIIGASIKVVTAESWNFGKLLTDSFGNKAQNYSKEAEKLKKFYYDYFIVKIGSAPFRGSGGSVKKGANNLGADGMAYRVYGCGIMKDPDDPIVVGLESTVVLPK